MTAQYIDAHCHIDAYEHPPQTLAAAAESGVVTVAVTELPSAYKRLRVRLGSRGFARVALGLHPLRANDVTTRERQLFVQELNTSDYVGEVGLDFSRAHPAREKQLKIFEWVLTQSIDQKILSVHSRGAEREIISLLASRRLSGAVLHWYTGRQGHVDNALDAGCFFSVNLPMLRSKKGQALLEMLPHDRVLTETDGPYAKNGRYTSHPADIPTVVELLANKWDLTPIDTRQIIWDNMARLHAATTRSREG